MTWGWLARIRPRDRGELILLASALAILVLLLGFFVLAGEVLEGGTQRLDDHVLMALRRADDPAVPIGPVWLRSAALDITALGSPTVLGLVVLAVAGFLWLQGMSRTAAYVTLASAGGSIVNAGLKLVFQRPRPDIVPHLRDVMSLSFPSGHAMTAATVYLTLGAVLMRVAERRITRFYGMAVAMLVTVLVGVSRVFLGVHYPTDVLAGWTVGLTWALTCWTVERGLEHRAGLRCEQRQAAEGDD